MPVRLVVNNEPSAVSITAHGAVPTELSGTGNGQAIVPWLAVTGAVRDVQWLSSASGTHPISVALHALSEGERLVGIAGGDPDIVAALFPEKRIIPVSLDLGETLDPPQAWESLDAAVFSPAALSRLNESARQVLAAAGTVLAVRATERPDDNLPWERFGGYWVLRYHPRGPNSVLDESAYMPTYGWERGWPGGFRRAVLLAAIVFSIVVTSVTLWRSRYTVVSVVIVCAVAAGLFAAWYRAQSPVLELRQGVVISDERLRQFDLWTWQASLRPSDTRFPADRLVHPIFATPDQADALHVRLTCDHDGRPVAFAFHLDPNQSLAFVTRYLSPAPLPPQLVPPAAALKDFAAEMYLRPGDQIAGQFTAQLQPGNPFPLVVIRRAEP